MTLQDKIRTLEIEIALLKIELLHTQPRYYKKTFDAEKRMFITKNTTEQELRAEWILGR
jgi:hypothetical protein